MQERKSICPDVNYNVLDTAKTPTANNIPQLATLLPAPFFLCVGLAVGAEVVPEVLPPGLLLWSFARVVIASPVMTAPLLSETVCVTLVAVTETNFPDGAGLIPLSIRSWTPGGTAGMVKLFEKVELLIREAEQLTGCTVVF